MGFDMKFYVGNIFRKIMLICVYFIIKLFYFLVIEIKYGYLLNWFGIGIIFIYILC